MNRTISNWFDKQASLKRFYKQLQQDNEVVQVTVTNHTREIRKVCLWGAIACTPVTDPMFLEGLLKETISVKGQPQAIAYNPLNDQFYVINQLDDSVTVISSQGTVVTTVALGTSLLPGTISPVDLAINTNPTSANYGYVAIACSVSDEVIFISPNHQITRRETVGKRPISIVYNSFDDCYYTANLVSGSISKICQVRRVNNLPLVEGARSLGVNPENGDLYVFSTVTKQVQVFNTLGNFRASYGTIDTDSIQFLFHPVEKTMYVVSDTLGQIDVLDTTRFRAIAKIALGNLPIAIAYNIHNQQVYVTTRDDQKIVKIGAKRQILEREELTDFNTGLAISTKADIIALSNSTNDTVSIFGNQSGPTVTVNEEYYEDREDFQHNPAMVGHVKLVASGEDRINALQITEKSVAGTEICKTISLSNSQSPQNFANVSEVFDFDGNLIDGHVTWCFKINPLQQVTFLIYYQQIEMYNLLPEKSRISTGVQMSKGIPVSWLDNPKDEPPNVATY